MDIALEVYKYTYKTFRANSGAIRFRITVDSLSNQTHPKIYLSADKCPHEKLYTITFIFLIRKINIEVDGKITQCIQMPKSLLSLKNTDMWLSWYKNRFRIGLSNNDSFTESLLLSFPLMEDRPTIGFITFRCTNFFNFHIKDPPVSVTDSFKNFQEGKLRWVKIRQGDKLPIDAVIGGYEGEVTYVARAEHNGSLCPGKYMSSKMLTYVPWGFEEHAKDNFEILCGYNYMWINCESPYLPDNAFKGGRSEVRNEPLYIGRAMIDGILVPGKVHMLYESCYLPYCGSEVCTKNYEILAVGYGETSECNWRRKCFKVNCAQPCA